MHDQTKEASGEKVLESWDDQSITFSTKGRKQKFTYPAKVLGPEVDQDQVHAEVAAELLEAFLQGYNCTFLAYG